MGRLTKYITDLRADGRFIKNLGLKRFHKTLRFETLYINLIDEQFCFMNKGGMGKYIVKNSGMSEHYIYASFLSQVV